jgi:hypothetical protein
MENPEHTGKASGSKFRSRMASNTDADTAAVYGNSYRNIRTSAHADAPFFETDRLPVPQPQAAGRTLALRRKGTP